MKKSLLLFAFVFSAMCGNAQTNIDSGLVVCLPFSGNANDASGNGHNGVVNGAVLTTDRFGNTNSAYDFDGVDDYVNLVGFGDKLNSEEVTVSFWAEGDAVKTQSPFLMIPDDGINRFNIHTYYLHNGNPTEFFDFGNISGGGRLFFEPWALPSTPTWEHFVLISSKKNNKIQLYINGNLVSSVSSYSTLTPDGTRDLHIGGGVSYSSSLFYFDGRLDDIRIYDRAISSTEVTSLFNLSTSCTVVGMAENNTSNEISIYPNPATSDLYIYNPSEKKTSLKILNMLGEIQMQTTLAKGANAVSVSQLPNGVYVAETVIDNKSIKKKFIINK